MLVWMMHENTHTSICTHTCTCTHIHVCTCKQSRHVWSIPPQPCPSAHPIPAQPWWTAPCAPASEQPSPACSWYFLPVTSPGEYSTSWDGSQKINAPATHLPVGQFWGNFCTVPRMDEVPRGPSGHLYHPFLLHCSSVPTSHFHVCHHLPEVNHPGLQFLVSGSAQDLHAHLHTMQCSSWKEGRPWTCSRLEFVEI